MSRKIRVAVVGFGNVGRAALEAIEITNDLEVAGIVTREYARATVQRQYPGLPVTSVATQLTDVDVAILAVPSRNVEEVASELLPSGISTVDSFDIHGSELWQLRQRLDIIAKGSGVAAILGAGWDQEPTLCSGLFLSYRHRAELVILTLARESAWGTLWLPKRPPVYGMPSPLHFPKGKGSTNG